MWDAIIDGEEVRVKPTSAWIRRALSLSKMHDDRFICLLRDAGDQMNALYVDGAFVMEWYRAEEGGPLAGFRPGEKRKEQPTRSGFFARLFGERQPIVGSRIPLEAAATILDAYVAGANEFDGLEWQRIGK
ncbi:hypothetical protein [Aurantiacibacter sp. D1-12]|uniref:hypothetical protein n=1 Tax=Aurantiacibacter sp. D1-12 TaxID=2993658 RepID=UPI00237D0E74|nr:hypothetical protein [Aurantiacibacter sp. D1-12]MDE1467367.1 hypothetical protein [Aurantiacibacter sp. D1-12]